MINEITNINVLCLSANCGAVIDFLPSSVDRIGFIGTAGDIYDDPHFVEADRKRLKILGYELLEIDISNLSVSGFKDSLGSVGAVYVAGGNTFYLLQELKKSNLDIILKQYLSEGLIYVGASAGAIILSKDINYVEEIDDKSKALHLEDTSGLNILNFSPLPHYGNPDYLARYHKIIEDNLEIRIVPFRDDEAISSDDGTKYTVHRSAPVSDD